MSQKAVTDEIEEVNSIFDNIFGNQDLVRGKYYQFIDSNSPVVVSTLSSLNHIKIPVLKGQIYSIKTKGRGVAYPFYVVDENYNIIQSSGQINIYEGVITINDSDAKYLIVNIDDVYIESSSVELINRFTRKLSDRIEAEAVILSMVSSGGNTLELIGTDENKIHFNYNPLFRTSDGKWFNIFPIESSVFEIPLTAYSLIVVKKSDIVNISVSSFQVPAYVEFESISSLQGNLDDYLILLETSVSSEIINNFAIGKFYNSEIIKKGGLIHILQTILLLLVWMLLRITKP